jgi:DNA invertase Pin-like site-specific DNA recombinase
MDFGEMRKTGIDGKSRLGRSLKQLIEIVTELQKRNVGFRSLTENIDTTSPGGKLVFHIFGSLAEFEHDLIRERTLAGLAAARARGRRGGRPRVASLNDERRIARAQALYSDRHYSIKDICEMLHISRTTLYRYISVKLG